MSDELCAPIRSACTYWEHAPGVRRALWLSFSWVVAKMSQYLDVKMCKKDEGVPRLFCSPLAMRRRAFRALKVRWGVQDDRST